MVKLKKTFKNELKKKELQKIVAGKKVHVLRQCCSHDPKSPYRYVGTGAYKD